MQHKFFIDRKQTVWERSFYNIEAETYEKAVERIKEIAETNEDEANEFDECQTLYETAIGMTPEENDGCSTVEVLTEDGNDTLWHNGKDMFGDNSMMNNEAPYGQDLYKEVHGVTQPREFI